MYSRRHTAGVLVRMIAGARDLVLSRDGSLSLTKLAAATFHMLLALTVAWITLRKQEFVFDMWALYAAVAVGHAGYDKTLASYRAMQDRKLAAEHAVKPDEPKAE